MMNAAMVIASFDKSSLTPFSFKKALPSQTQIKIAEDNAES